MEARALAAASSAMSNPGMVQPTTTMSSWDGDGWGLLQAVPNLSAEAVQMPPELSTAQREALLG